jgi:hypothetical protein
MQLRSMTRCLLNQPIPTARIIDSSIIDHRPIQILAAMMKKQCLD